jgi:hypothetical protein
LVLSVVLVVSVLSIYCWRHGHCSLCLRGRQQGVNASNPANPQPRQRQGVVRTDLEAGVPSYTLQPTKGELSLGIGRKRSVEEEYGLAETMADHEREDSDERSIQDPGTSQNASANIQISLPPYIPPPEPAVVSGGSTPQTASRYSQGTRRYSSPGITRGQSHAQHN